MNERGEEELKMNLGGQESVGVVYEKVERMGGYGEGRFYLVGGGEGEGEGGGVGEGEGEGEGEQEIDRDEKVEDIPGVLHVT